MYLFPLFNSATITDSPFIFQFPKVSHTTALLSLIYLCRQSDLLQYG